MWKKIRLMAAGAEGAVRGLIVAFVVCGLMAVFPTVLVSLTTRGTVDLDTFVPRPVVAPSQNTTISIEGSAADRRVVRRALDELVWPVRSPKPRIVITPAQQMPTNAAGTYAFPDNVIRISEDVMRDPVGEGLPHILAHEIGHQLDAQYLDEPGRAEFMTLRGHDSLMWTGDGAAWGDIPMEDFAEVFAVLDAPSSPVGIQTNGGRIESRKQMAAFIRRYEKRAVRTVTPPRELSLLPFVKALSQDYMTQPDALLVALGVFILCTVLGAGHAAHAEMLRIRRRERARSRSQVQAG
ncbi:MAG: hypothetical protein CVT67_02675 [Actinobacteria bacterium HGW-Actinobacteria-7]|nr:MAG: hypothetical protein CVT67_02675 [Actinobacteria bacterium HGW-Actinobacteria-7]